MPFTPTDSTQIQRLSLIEKVPKDEIFIKITGREEINYLPHVHNRHQIIYILSGTLHIETEDCSYFVTDRHLVWIPNGIEHRLSSNNRQISLLTIYFYIDDKPNDKFAIYTANEFITHNLKFISSHKRIKKALDTETFTFAESFFKLLPIVGQETSFPYQPFILIRDKRLRPVLEYIRNNFQQDLTIENVAALFGFSVRNLTRMFTNSGIRFVHYLNCQRVVRAIEILTDNTMNIEQTAYEVGFNSPNSFYRVFRHITGQSPSMYLHQS